jgi:hypothetical protein
MNQIGSLLCNSNPKSIYWFFVCLFIYFLVVVGLFLALHALLGPLQRCTNGGEGRKEGMKAN